ncbi:uncharacterized protein TNCV_3084881 [Trichonephila clavipes]|nr:uncharacterized protein TNCV_3084881 [Trichonephila clavipes]
MATKKKQRKTEDENHEFKVEWTDNFAFIQNLNGLPTCLICKEKFAHYKKSNLERHFTRHTRHLEINILPVMQGRKQLRNFRRVKNRQLLRLIIGCNLPAILICSQHKWSALNYLEKEDMIIFNAWNSIPDSYDQLKKLSYAVLSLFGSIYICEQSFSSMNIIKSKLRSRLIDENLESCLKLKTTTYKPDLLKLSKEMQAHCSQ